MNIPSLTRVTLMALALGTASATAAFAQTTPTTMTPNASAPTTPAPTPAPTGKGKEKGMKKLSSVLTPTELAQYQKDQAAVFASNPELKTEADALASQHAAIKAQGKTSTGTDADAKSTLKLAAKEHMKKMEVAMMKIDPSIQPVLAKIKAAHKASKNGDAGAPATT